MAKKIKSPAKKSSYNPHRPKGVSSKAFQRVYWPYIPIVIVTIFGFVFSNISSSLSAARNHSNVLAYATSMSVGGLLSETNTQRNANGAAGLSLNGQLNAAAQAKANDMASRNYWSHNTPEGNPPWVFVSAQGYSYQKIGENLATGFSTEAAAVSGWMNSPGHRANMLDTAFVEVGFGFANNANYSAAGGGPQTIVVAFYGLPVNAAPATCPAGQVGTPPNCSTPAPVVEQSITSTPSTPTTPAPSTPKEPTPAPETTNTPEAITPEKTNTKEQPTEPRSDQPVNNETGIPITTTLQPTNRLGLMVSGPAAQWLTVLTLLTMGAAAIFWVGRHALMVRRAFVTGEQFVLHHPVVDVVIVAIIAVAYTLTQTVGFIQ